TEPVAGRTDGRLSSSKAHPQIRGESPVGDCERAMDWFRRLPPVTRLLLGSSVVVTALTNVGQLKAIRDQHSHRTPPADTYICALRGDGTHLHPQDTRESPGQSTASAGRLEEKKVSLLRPRGDVGLRVGSAFGGLRHHCNEFFHSAEASDVHDEKTAIHILLSPSDTLHRLHLVEKIPGPVCQLIWCECEGGLSAAMLHGDWAGAQQWRIAAA
ncbi:hypothetical protein THAOC_12862, partial [Thalassiosira oceanica]